MSEAECGMEFNSGNTEIEGNSVTPIILQMQEDLKALTRMQLESVESNIETKLNGKFLEMSNRISEQEVELKANATGLNDMVATIKFYVDEKAKEIQIDFGQKLEELNLGILEKLGQLKERFRVLESNLIAPNSDSTAAEQPVQPKGEEIVLDPKAVQVLEKCSGNTSGRLSATAEVSEMLNTTSPKAKGMKLKIKYKLKDIRECQHCRGSFSRKSVRRHERKCSKSKTGRCASEK